MPDKLLRMHRTGQRPTAQDRPVMLAIAGDSASGKTTITAGLVKALGPERCTAVCVDDYHRYDRAERKSLPFTALHPDCNYVDIMEQHLQLLATGHPVLKPVYDHHTGTLTRPQLVEPREFVIIEGLLPLHTKLAAACFDVTVFLNPPEAIRRDWKIKRDTTYRGYTQEQVRAELDRREPESERFILPQRARADIEVRFAPVEQRADPPGTPLSAELLLRPTIRHPDLTTILAGSGGSMHLKLTRDSDGRPVDSLHVHGYAPREETQLLEKAIWSGLDGTTDLPAVLGDLGDGKRSEPLAVTQLLLLHHLIEAAR
jgi:phosphoribulokinase